MEQVSAGLYVLGNQRRLTPKAAGAATALDRFRRIDKVQRHWLRSTEPASAYLALPRSYAAYHPASLQAPFPAP